VLVPHPTHMLYEMTMSLYGEISRGAICDSHAGVRAIITGGLQPVVVANASIELDFLVALVVDVMLSILRLS
jgi:hypothetical protein